MGIALACAACLAGPAGRWRSPYGRRHPLVGRIFDARGARFLSADELADRLRDPDFVLLGESHENVDQHRLQAWVLREMVRRGRRPAVAFEMIDLDQSEVLERQRAEHPDDVDGLGEAVRWQQSGWPPWKDYRPIFAEAVRAGLPIVAANLSHATLHGLSRDRELLIRLGVDQPLPAAVQASMIEEFRQAHCGHLSAEMGAALVTAQRARDAQMAVVLLAAGEGRGAVLVAGHGHVRRDRAVPLHLRTRRPEASVTALAFLEALDGADDPSAYVTDPDSPEPLFDYVWFTPRADDEDPCERFRPSLERLETKTKPAS